MWSVLNLNHPPSKHSRLACGRLQSSFLAYVQVLSRYADYPLSTPPSPFSVALQNEFTRLLDFNNTLFDGLVGNICHTDDVISVSEKVLSECK